MQLRIACIQRKRQMATGAQRYVDLRLGNGQSNRTDYSNRRLTRAVPRTLQQFDELRRAAHDAGPGSAQYSDYMALLQAGLDRDSLPDAAGGGVPRSVAATQAELGDAAEDAREYFKAGVHPMLHEYGIPGQGSFAELGPDVARAVVTEMMATSTSKEQRAALVELSKAIDNSPTSSLGIVIEAPDERLEYTISMGDDSNADPSGFTQWREGQAGLAPGLPGLMLRARDTDDTWDGLDAAAMSGNGGTFSVYEAKQLAAARAGDLQALQLDSQGMSEGDFHQGDATGDVISSY